MGPGHRQRDHDRAHDADVAGRTERTPRDRPEDGPRRADPEDGLTQVVARISAAERCIRRLTGWRW